ncbi:MAG: DsbA family oxidoreductase [Woeseiaceae bacterium]
MSQYLSNIVGQDGKPLQAALQVDVIADLVCPWCYLGKRRLDDALLAVHGPSNVSWYPFQLNPAMPAAGMEFEEYLASKFGDPKELRPALEQLTTEGRMEGVNFRFDKLSRVPSTLNAHRLMKLAETERVNTSDLAEEFLKGFFESGLDIGDRDVLIELATRHGLEISDINKTLDDDLSRRAVLAQEAQVRQGGITGVPAFLVNKRLFVVGAQSTEALVSAFDRAIFGEFSDNPVAATIH